MKNILSILLFALSFNAYGAITISPSTISGLVTGQQYKQPLTASGGTLPYIIFKGSGTLPAGTAITYNNYDAFLEGIPTTAASYVFSITARDATGATGSQSYTVTVTAGGTVTSVGAVGGTGISVTGSPITGSGTFTITNTAPTYSMAIGNNITSATSGSILFAGTAGKLQQINSKFFFDSTNTRVGVGINNPGSTVDIKGVGSSLASSSLAINNSSSALLFKIYDSGQIDAGGISDNLFFGENSGLNLTSGGNNIALGSGSQFTLTEGNNNVSQGRASLYSVTDGDNNVGIGGDAGANITTGSDNTCLGYSSASGGTGLTTGGRNVAIGPLTLFNGAGAARNTIVGYAAGHDATGTDNVMLGYHSGYYEDGNSKLFIDNTNRSDASDGRLKALVYGVFASTTAAQYITFNSHVLVREDLQFTSKTINTTAGDAATIDSPAGRFRKDATGATFTLTDSYVTANSIILLTAANAAVDATAVTWTVSAGSGTATITFVAAPTANFDMNFLIIN